MMRVNRTDIQGCREEYSRQGRGLCKCPEAGLSLALWLKHSDECGEERGADRGGHLPDPIGSQAMIRSLNFILITKEPKRLMEYCM